MKKNSGSALSSFMVGLVIVEQEPHGMDHLYSHRIKLSVLENTELQFMLK